MRKYNKKELKFIANHDLAMLIEYIPIANAKQQSRLQQVVKYAKQLIDYSEQKNAEKMFQIADSVEEELIDEWNKLADLYDEGVLTEGQLERYDLVYDLKEELQILTNLHPEKILTWEDVAHGYI